MNVARALIAISCAAGGLLACSVEAVELAGKACPCAEGYTCHERTGLCVLGSVPSFDEVAIDLPDGGQYRIDATEVTTRAYKAFLDSNPDPTTQPAICAWNATFVPAMETELQGDCRPPYDLTRFLDEPIRCVDWCDARAYCAWKGQRLCGRIDGGSLPPVDLGDATKDQWFRACSRDGERTYPYGNTYELKCNTEEFVGRVLDVRQLRCEGGYPGLFDMSGNVAEWGDSCKTSVDVPDPKRDLCFLRGGPFWGNANDARCDVENFTSDRAWMGLAWGFRCCRD